MSSIKLSPNASGTGEFTIAAPNSNTNRTLTLPDNTGTILTTGTAGVPVNGPAFSAYLSTATQTLSNATLTKIQINSKEFDTNTCYDATTNYRFTPTVAGYYQINGAIQFANANTNSFVTIYKNGSEFKRGNEAANSNAYAGLNFTVAALVYLNGSTDYVELYGYQGSGANSNVSGLASGTYFQAFMARSAV